jgi:hypothetical protein
MSNVYKKIETEFKIGNTDFNTRFFITVPDYGVSIPECHTSGPIIYPVNRPLTDIINMIERGIHVQFEDKDAPERIYFFLKKYNEVATEVNNRCGQDLNPIITTSLEYIKLKLNFIDNSKDKEVDTSNPFTKRILTTSSNEYKGNRYTNESIANRFKRNKKKIVENKPASEHKMFEMFADSTFVGEDGSLNTGDTEIFSPVMPNFYEDIEFGE